MGELLESRSAGPASNENRRSWLVHKLLSDDVGAAEPRAQLVDLFCELYARHGRTHLTAVPGGRVTTFRVESPGARAII